MKVRIYYHDTDAGGVVYYANYLKYLEQARTEFFEQRGIYIKPLADAGTMFVVARQEIDYRFPAVYGDMLEAEVVAVKVGAVKVEFQQEIKNQGAKLICQAKTIMVCVDREIKPHAIPEEILGKLEKGVKG